MFLATPGAFPSNGLECEVAVAFLLLGFAGYFFVSAYIYSDVKYFRFTDEQDVEAEPGPVKVYRLLHMGTRIVAGIACLAAGIRAIG